MTGLPHLILLTAKINSLFSKRIVDNINVDTQTLVNVGSSQLKNKIYGQRVKEISRIGLNLIFFLTGNHYIIIQQNLDSEIVINADQNPNGLFLQINFEDGQSIKFAGFSNKIEYCFFDIHKSKLLSKLSNDITLLTQNDFVKIFDSFDSKKSISKALEYISGCEECIISEALFLAKVNPKKKIATITHGEKQLIYESIFEFLNKTINNLRKFKINESITLKLFVYNRIDKPCFHCGNPIKTEKSGNKTIISFCSYCQK